MQYPTLLMPTTVEEITLPSGRAIQVPKAETVFTPWSGEAVKDTYGGKPVLDFNDRPAFAELAILRMFQDDGWSGVWVDTYRKKYRTACWPKNEVELPSEQRQLLQRIYEKAGSRKGCWDVFCWQGGEHLFAESKWHGHDCRDTQKRWLEAVLECGLPLASFLIGSGR